MVPVVHYRSELSTLRREQLGKRRLDTLDNLVKKILLARTDNLCVISLTAGKTLSRGREIDNLRVGAVNLGEAVELQILDVTHELVGILAENNLITECHPLDVRNRLPVKICISLVKRIDLCVSLCLHFKTSYYLNKC